MLINEKPLQHWIDHFYGYGSWDAKIWFVTYEESGGDLPEEVAEKIDYFYSTNKTSIPALCDLREIYKQVLFRIEGPRAKRFKNLYDHRFGTDAVLHGVWKNLIAFVHGFRQQAVPNLLEYQQKVFATGKSEALINLLPLPSPHAHAWYYAWLDLPGFQFLKSRVSYQDQVYPNRIHTLIEKIRKHQPDVVLMYGMENINRIKQSIQEYFPEQKFKMVKSIKLQLPQYHRIDVEGTILLITTQTPALRHNRIETGYEWEYFGRSVANYNED